MKKIRNASFVKAVFAAYFLCSVLFSIAIAVRLLLTVDIILTKLSTLMYLALFFVVPMVSVYWLLYASSQRKSRLKWFFFFLLIAYVISLVVTLFVWPFFPEYVFFWFPVPLMMFLDGKWKAGGGFGRRKIVFAIVLSLIAVLLPDIAVYVSTASLLSQTTGMSELERASFISQRVFDMTAFGMLPRADNDYWRFLLTGGGMCKEMSIAGVNLMNAVGLTARRIVFPGEDHALIEVKIGGSWLVSDPGSYRGILISRTERAEQRIERVGSLSYVIAYREDGFIELTQQYVSTDTIVINVKRNGEPVAGAEVALRHRFNGIITQLPSDDRTFQSDVNGTVTLHLGRLHYIHEFKGSEEYYWIYVNGKDSGYNVTSTGTGQLHLLEIDLNS